MTLEEKVEAQGKQIEYLQSLCEALLRSAWNERGRYKGLAKMLSENASGIAGKQEKELEPFMADWLEKQK